MGLYEEISEHYWHKTLDIEVGYKFARKKNINGCIAEKYSRQDEY